MINFYQNMIISVNYLPILLSAVASMVIGSIWYGPLFGKKYMHLMGMGQWSEEEKGKMKKAMWVTYVVQFAASLVTFYFLAWVMSLANQMTTMGGVMTAVCVWLGVVVPLKLGDALWGGKMGLFWLGIGNMLVTLAVGGAIIGS